MKFSKVACFGIENNCLGFVGGLYQGVQCRGHPRRNAGCITIVMQPAYDRNAACITIVMQPAYDRNAACITIVLRS